MWSPLVAERKDVSADESGISEKSIFRLVRRALATTRAPRADEPDRFRIATSPFNRTVVLRYRIHLEQRQYAPATINLRLAAIRRVANEAADAGLLSPELAASIRRVRGVRRIGMRTGNWLTVEQGRRLLDHDGPTTLRGLRNYAMVALLIGCGLRRGELLALTLESFQQREEHWVIADFVGKAGHVRTVPVPAWVKGWVQKDRRCRIPDLKDAPYLMEGPAQ